MPSGITAKLVAENIIESIKKGEIITPHRGSLGNMGAACVASSRIWIHQRFCGYYHYFSYCPRLYKI